MYKTILPILFLFHSAIFASECPNDTFLKSEFCKSVAAKNDSDRINLLIILAPQDNTGAYTSFNDAKEWSKILFEKYELQNCDNIRVSVPPDSGIRWDYRLLSTTKAEAVSILKEPFIAQLSLMEQPAGCKDFSCPGPKYEGITCDSLQIKPSNAYFTVTIEFYRLAHHPPCYNEVRGGIECAETEDDSANRKSLRQWTSELFSKFDLRLSRDSSISAPAPSEEDLYWFYGPYKATAATILELIKETYVYEATIWDHRNLPTTGIAAPIARRKLRHENDLFYVNGRKVEGKWNSARRDLYIFR